MPRKWNQTFLKLIISRSPICSRCAATKGLCTHHIVPVSEGGLDEPSNIDVLCLTCHREWHYHVEGKQDYVGFVVSMPERFLYNAAVKPELRDHTVADIQEAWSRIRQLRREFAEMKDD